MMREILGARDDAWLVVRRKPHRLRFVELRVLKSSKPQQAILKPRMQAFFGDIDLIAQDKFQRRRQFPDDWRFPSMTRRRRRPRLRISVILWWQPHTKNAASSFSVVDDLFNLWPPDLANAREKCPLVGPRDESVIEKDRVVLFAGGHLERQSNQVSKSSLRHRVLIGKQPVVRIEADVRTPFHRLGENVRSQSSGKCGRNGFFEEEPHVCAPPGA
jgi:hypothetical protein